MSTPKAAATPPIRTTPASASGNSEGAAGGATSAHAIRQQIFQRLQQLEENKAKYTERARHFLDREKTSSSPVLEPASTEAIPDPSDNVDHHRLARELHGRMDGVVSDNTRNHIKASLVGTQVRNAVSDEVHSHIRSTFDDAKKTESNLPPRGSFSPSTGASDWHSPGSSDRSHSAEYGGLQTTARSPDYSSLSARIPNFADWTPTVTGLWIEMNSMQGSVPPGRKAKKANSHLDQ